MLKRVAVPFPREKAMAHRDEDGDIILSLKMIDRTQDRLRESTFNPKNLVLRAYGMLSHCRQTRRKSFQCRCAASQKGGEFPSSSLPDSPR